MPELVDWLDTLLIGAFLFGLLLAVSTALLGGLHLDGHGGHADSHGWLPFSLTGGLVFLTWLGGLGYLFRRGLDWPAPVAVVVAAVAGFALAAAVQRLLALLSRSEDGGLDPARTRVVGSLGVLASPVRSDGIGEVVYVMGGARQTLPARSADGTVLGRGDEVVILRVQDGIAYVQSFDPFIEPRLGRPEGTPP